MSLSASFSFLLLVWVGMSGERVPSDYARMGFVEAELFDKKVKEHFMPAIISMVKQIIEDYDLQGVCVDVGCGTAVFAVELCRHSNLTIYALEREEAICKVAYVNIKREGLKDRIIPVLGDAHKMPFKDEFADFVISRGSYHCWEDKVLVFKEVYRVLKRGGIALVGGGFGRYVTEEELKRMKLLRDLSLGENAKAYSSPDKLREVVYRAGIPNFRIIYDPVGLWAEIKK